MGKQCNDIDNGSMVLVYIFGFPCEGLAIQEQVYQMGSAPQSNNMEMDHKAPIVYTHFTPHIESLLYSSLIIASQSFVLPMIFEWKVKKKKADKELSYNSINQSILPSSYWI